MKTITITNCGISPKLVRAVLRQLGADKDEQEGQLRDIACHGADGGGHGFTYTKDTVAFFKKNRREISELVARRADDLGETPAEMVAGFLCLGGRALCELDRKHLYGTTPDHERRAVLAEYLPSVFRCLYGCRLTDDDDSIANALAWFALEEVARAMSGE